MLQDKTTNAYRSVVRFEQVISNAQKAYINGYINAVRDIKEPEGYTVDVERDDIRHTVAITIRSL